jgi:hypothetical protein
VALPQLPDVHRAFASSALCSLCGAAAEAGEADTLTQRAEIGWADDEPEVVLDVVSLVLAAAGHRPAPKPVPPAELRRPSPQPLTGEDAAIWAGLEPLVHDGPPHEVVVQGRIENVYQGVRSVTLVECAGPRARLTGEDGQPWLITDGLTMWRRSDTGMIASRYTGPAWAGEGSELAHHRSREEVEVFGFGQPIGPIEHTEYLGRSAWRFAFAAPPHKPFDMRVVIDAATGLILEQRFGDASTARWTSFVTGEQIDSALFRWDGPSTSEQDMRAAQQREHDAEMDRRAAWFAQNVTDQPLSIRGEPIDVLLHEWEPDGSFQASLNGGLDGALARRPRSTTWWQLGWSSVTHRWSDQQWDWALSIWHHDEPTGFNASDLAALARALGSTPPPQDA